MNKYYDQIMASDQLPSLPAVAVRILELTQNPNVDIREIVTVLKRDPALASRLLRTANSTLFGMRNQITTIDQAAPLFGTLALSSLALGFSLMTTSSSDRVSAAEMESFWFESLTRAVAASELVKHSGGGSPSEFFVAGLLQDIGCLALLRTLPDEYVKIRTEARDCQRSLPEIEQSNLEFTHVDIGIDLLTRWGLPPRIIEAITYHHADPESIKATTARLALTRALITANTVSELFSSQRPTSESRARSTLSDFYSLDEHGQDQLMESINESVRKLAEPFQLNAEAYDSYEDILAQARTTLINVACQAQRDPLTGVYAQDAFEPELNHCWQTAADMGESLGLILVNLDCPDDEEVSDDTLKWVAHELKSLSGESSFLARLLDNGFVALRPQSSQQDLIDLAENARRAIACHTDTDLDTDCVTASVAAVLCSPRAFSLDEPSVLVDTALGIVREATRTGGNQIRFAPLAPELN